MCPPGLQHGLGHISHSSSWRSCSPRLDRVTLPWVQSWLMGGPGSGATSSCSLVTSGVPLGQWPALFNVCIDDLGEGIEAPSGNLWMTPSWVGRLICWRAGGSAGGSGQTGSMG